MLRFVLDTWSRHVRMPDHFRHSPAALDHLVSDDIIPRILSHERIATLHMSAVRLGGAAVAFCGRSGQGKSTLAAAMMRAGHALLTDDCLTLTPLADGVIARGLSASLRVWPQTFEAMFAEDGIVSGEAGPPGKLRVDLDGDAAAEAGPLDAIYVLQPAQDSGDEIKSLRLSPAEACGHLVRNSFGIDLWSADWKAWLIGSCAEIAARVPVFTLSYPRRFDCLPKVIDHLETRHMDSLAGRAP
ncbi:hypothetical protein [Tropicimonas isoalkanivorans]|uniref:hypothetical protein n=1 Tax=Tropicimonas isoalkanivorans TaxID=441112 RepID=UPI0011603DD8|nr:hypothetical protein [Tropicimonas isoalkanivorans]